MDNTTKVAMTVREFGTSLGIGRKKAYELVNSKGFPSFRIGRKVLINREGLKRWMQEQEEKKDAD